MQLVGSIDNDTSWAHTAMPSCAPFLSLLLRTAMAGLCLEALLPSTYAACPQLEQHACSGLGNRQVGAQVEAKSMCTPAGGQDLGKLILVHC